MRNSDKIRPHTHEFLAFNILLRIKSEQKVKEIDFVHQYFLKLRLNQFFNKKYTHTNCVWIVIRYFLFEKHVFNGLLQVIIYKWIYNSRLKTRWRL